MSSQIVGIISCLPKRRIQNDFFEANIDSKTVHDIAKMAGVETRYWASESETTADLCIHAAQQLGDKVTGGISDCDAVIFVTQTPDYVLPGSSFVAHRQLGLPSDCTCLDINAGCSGYVLGLSLAHDLISGGRYKKVLLLAGDTISKTLSVEDRSTAMIFGDAGTATLITASETTQKPKFIIGSDSSGIDSLKIENGQFRSAVKTNDKDDYLYMDGASVFNFTLKSIPKLIKDLAKLDNKEPTDFAYVLMHQANAFMLKHIAKKAKLNPDQVPINIQDFGNTSSATLPLLLCSDVREQIQGPNQPYALLGFGVGFSWAAVSMEIGNVQCAETVFL
ncbi:3-oxoacyl-ACP synthase [Amylibacter marinus]|uniref:3-oxoacyl-ACP synthase n=1 Tax=Amylibacter marinus TaxID=1475483 RepID=A0ABQ5VXN0_9RHOB|nr:ketoacyl-ACP synthase III [Amylibacter marinus]GLQ35972.1 3-oxoacyl-ACP synthase [Amylibacter marinus]